MAGGVYIRGGEVKLVLLEVLLNLITLALRKTHLDGLTCLGIDEKCIRFGFFDDELEGILAGW